MADPDARDIQASLTGNEAAFARLVERHQAGVARIMWRFTRNEGQLAELVQDVFVEAYFSLPSYRGEAPLAHWLARIATRVGYRSWKDRARQPKHLPIQAADGAAWPADGLAPSQAAEILDALLSRLRPAERLVLTLQYFDRRSAKEIARRMGWTVAMVKMRSYRAKRKLRQIAEREELLEKLEWTP